MRNLKISARLTVGFGFVITLLIGISLFAVVEINASKYRIQQMAEETYLKSELAHQLKDNTNLSARNLRNALLSRSTEEARQYLQKIEDTRTSNAAVMEKLGALIHSQQGRLLFDGMKAHQVSYVAARAKVIGLIVQGRKEEATDAMFGELRKEQAAYFDAQDKVVRFQADLMIESSKGAVVTARTAVLVIAALATAAIVLATVCAWWITRSVTGPALKAVESASRIAQGDLTLQIEAKTNDEMGQLMRALETMNASLISTVSGVRSGIEAINSAAERISSENTALAGRTEEQAASLEQSAASMTQLTDMVKQNADNARLANSVAVDASSIADMGQIVVREMIETIDKVNERASKISEITGVIEGIAFQTNILALNAAVEAARAGEQGRGFAVVASEVRSLAQRSAAAAKEIKVLIETSVGLIQDGARQASEVGERVERIKQAVKHVLEVVAEISAASGQQAAGIDEVHTAISQIDQATQQNAALVEEAAAAARALEEQSVELRAAISVFKVDERT